MSCLLSLGLPTTAGLKQGWAAWALLEYHPVLLLSCAIDHPHAVHIKGIPECFGCLLVDGMAVVIYLHGIILLASVHRSLDGVLCHAHVWAHACNSISQSQT